MTSDILIRVILLLLGITGFLVAKHIRNHKIKNTPLVCPIGFDCNAVVHSDYSRFLGMPVEIFGMIYYALISALYLYLLFIPGNLPAILPGSLVIVSFFAFAFSMYLIAVQIFILKKGCSWCIVSAFICLLIFILTTSTYHLSSVALIFAK